MSPILLATEVCDRCGRAPQLLGRVLGEQLCSECWKRAGSPFPPPLTREEVAQMEREG